MVVVGVGVRPVTQFLEGVELDQDGGVVVDSQMRAADGIYAAPATSRALLIRAPASVRASSTGARHSNRAHGGAQHDRQVCNLRRRSLLLDAAV